VFARDFVDFCNFTTQQNFLIRMLETLNEKVDVLILFIKYHFFKKSPLIVIDKNILKK
jgi:hypothetical protein